MKERFATIWGRHTFTTQGLAAEAGVAESVILAMLEGRAVAQGVATHVLATFATLTCKPYSLENVEIALIEETGLAALLAAIDEETDAATQGLYGLALGTARHAFITARMEAIIGPHYDALKQANQT